MPGPMMQPQRPNPPYSGTSAMYYPTNMNGPQRPSNNPFDNYMQPPQSYIPLNGRVVQHPDDILPKEVPMDGTVSLFPLNDYSAIIAKMWTNDGRLIPIKYIPEPEVLPQQPNTQNRSSESNASNEQMRLVLEKLDRLDEAMNLMQDFLTQPPKQTSRSTAKTVKKEAADNESVHESAGA